MGDAMITLHEECLVDEAGNRKAVVLPLAAWQQIKEELDLRFLSVGTGKAKSSVPTGG
jgi:hypothetical protein